MLTACIKVLIIVTFCNEFLFSFDLSKYVRYHSWTINSFDRKSSSGETKRYNNGNGGRGRGGGGRSYSRPDTIPIRFAKTIKIDPDDKTRVEDMPLSIKTKKVLVEKGFEFMTPIQSQSYDLVYSVVDVVGIF